MLIGFRLCLIAECIVCKERNSLFVTLRLGGWMGWDGRWCCCCYVLPLVMIAIDRQVHSRLVGLGKVIPGCLRIIKDFIIANKYYAID